MIKYLYSLIQTDLAIAISRYLTAGTLPVSYRESTTITLRKKDKKNYIISDSYRLITLKNTLIKLLEKVLIIQIMKIAEEHNLLP